MCCLQLEYGAEIGRGVVEFEGRIFSCVVVRYRGGACVVFSKALYENLVSLAVAGTFASVIGGAPAATVVFPRELQFRTSDDPRATAARLALNDAPEDTRPRLREQLARLRATVHAEKKAELAREFDAVHSVPRAKALTLRSAWTRWSPTTATEPSCTRTRITPRTTRTSRPRRDSKASTRSCSAWPMITSAT
jgi:hypothetical protein